MTDTWEKMNSGELYDPTDPALSEQQQKCLELLYEYNLTRPSEAGRRRELLTQMFASFGEDSYIEPPLHANWGGKFTSIGRHVYANFGLTLVDDTFIEIGDDTKIGPHVTICAGTHPTDPEQRRKSMQYNRPVKIGRNCWIGAGSVILPGVTIGDNSVIGAGSVVTKDIPANVVAFGDPCRVIRSV